MTPTDAVQPVQQASPAVPKPPSRALDLSKPMLHAGLIGLAALMMGDHHAVAWIKAHAPEFMAAISGFLVFAERLQSAASKFLGQGQQVAAALAPIAPVESQEITGQLQVLQTFMGSLEGRMDLLHKKVDAVSATYALPPNPFPPPPAAFTPKPGSTGATQPATT